MKTEVGELARNIDRLEYQKRQMEITYERQEKKVQNLLLH